MFHITLLCQSRGVMHGVMANDPSPVIPAKAGIFFFGARHEEGIPLSG
jgi:hypothetical protein